MRMVKIVHPQIEGEHEVPERSVRIWANSGWKRADETPEQPYDKGGELPPGESVKNSGEAEPVIAESNSRRRRGSSKESD